MIVQILILIALIVVVFLLNFYRDPPRDVPGGKSIVSPADGKVIQIKRITQSDVKVKKGILGKIFTKNLGKECWMISIFMNPLDVHVNRTPLAGKVVEVKHSKGKFFNASDVEKSLLNEKAEIAVKTSIGTIKIIQIAGFVARRIMTKVKKGQHLKKGQRIGLIALGSQVTVLLPASINVCVYLNQRVRAGESIVGEYA